MRKSAAKVLDDGLTKAHRVLADYISPDRRLDASQVVDKLLGILDDGEFIEAWAELHEEAHRSESSQPMTLLHTLLSIRPAARALWRAPL